jgi:hypothetical protein
MSYRKTCGVIVLVILAGTAAQSAFAVSLATVHVTQSNLESTVFEVTVPDVQTRQVVVGSDTFTRLTLAGANPAQLDTDNSGDMDNSGDIINNSIPVKAGWRSGFDITRSVPIRA